MSSLAHFDNGINGARLLTETAVDALCHVDIIARRASRAVWTRLCLNGDRLRRTTINAALQQRAHA